MGRAVVSGRGSRGWEGQLEIGGAVVDGWEWQWVMGGAVVSGRGSRGWERQ